LTRNPILSKAKVTDVGKVTACSVWIRHLHAALTQQLDLVLDIKRGLTIFHEYPK